MFSFFRRRRQKVMSRKAYYLMQTIFWLYTIGWFSSWWFLYTRLAYLPMLLKAFIAIALLLVTPALRDLFFSYDSYEQQASEASGRN